MAVLVAGHSRKYKIQNKCSCLYSIASLPNKLTHFYAPFDMDKIHALLKNDQPLTFSTTNVQALLSTVNTRKATELNSIPCCVHRACTEQLSGDFTDIFNLCIA